MKTLFNFFGSAKTYLILIFITVFASSCYIKKRVYNRGFHFERLTEKKMAPQNIDNQEKKTAIIRH